MIDLKKLTIKSAHEAMIRGDFTAQQLAEKYLEQVKERNNDINAYLEIYDDVIEQAKNADKKIKDRTELFNASARATAIEASAV